MFDNSLLHFYLYFIEFYLGNLRNMLWSAVPDFFHDSRLPPDPLLLAFKIRRIEGKTKKKFTVAAGLTTKTAAPKRNRENLLTGTVAFLKKVRIIHVIR